MKPGKGPAFVRTKLKNIETRATLDKTWRAGESYPDADVDKQIMQYSYIDGDDHVFMNMVRLHMHMHMPNHSRSLSPGMRPAQSKPSQSSPSHQHAASHLAPRRKRARHSP